MDEIQYGGIAVSVILTVILGIIYKSTGDKIPDKYRALIAVSCGTFLGVLAIPYKGLEWTVPTTVDYLIQGIMIGASAVGLYELQRTGTNPRS